MVQLWVNVRAKSDSDTFARISESKLPDFTGCSNVILHCSVTAQPSSVGHSFGHTDPSLDLGLGENPIPTPICIVDTSRHAADP